MKRKTHNLSFQAILTAITDDVLSFRTNVTTAWMQDVETRRERRPRNLLLVISSVARNLALPILFLAFTPITFAADDLGRLFTTPQQRQTLEKLRSQKPVEEIKIPAFTFAEPVVEEQKPVIGGITVNGLVYRKSGKSTAWINSANTYEGNFGNQYIQIDAQNIKPEDVEILIPINETKVKLKTGQTYDPETDQIISPGYQDN